MKNLFTRFAFAVALGGLMISNSPVFAQGTAFTYQGRLDNGTNLANGNYDLTFSLFNASVSGSQIGSTITNLDVVVSNGLFTTSADFGPVFNGTAYWLQIGVRSNGGSSFTLLTPLQELTPTPYSITAENVSGVIPLSQLPATVALISDPGSTGSKNFFAGQEAGNASLSGAANTGVGYEALFGNASGNYNTALGVSALAHDYTGGYNTALGAAALEWNNTGSYNTATGYNAMANIPSYVTGDYNTANGAWALTDDDSGSNNSAIGVQALYQNTTGNGNIALGYQAGYDNLSGNDNIDIGNVGSSSDNGVMRLGTPGLQSKTIIAGTAVGLNTSTPSQALEVNGNFVEIDGANAYNGAGQPRHSSRLSGRD